MATKGIKVSLVIIGFRFGGEEVKVARRGEEGGERRWWYKREGLDGQAGIKVTKSKGENLAKGIARYTGTRGQK